MQRKGGDAAPSADAAAPLDLSGVAAAAPRLRALAVDVQRFSIFDPRPPPAAEAHGLQQLSGLLALTSLALPCASRWTPDAISDVSCLTGLHELRLDNAGVDKSMLAPLTALRRLSSLCGSFVWLAGDDVASRLAVQLAAQGGRS